jgi:hypothetical protein
VTSLTLSRLGEREVCAIVAHLADNKELTADVMVEIVRRTDGIPLFVEEMTKAVLEAESEEAARQTVAAVPSSALAIPAIASVSDGAAGPPRSGQGSGADWGGDWSGVLLRADFSRGGLQR